MLISCLDVSEFPGPPSIRLNSDLLSNQSEVALAAGSDFTLSCHGNASIKWSSSALNLLYQGSLANPIEVTRSNPRYTGTYRCGYTNQSLGHLHTWIHLYVRDPAQVFVTPRSQPQVREGQDFLFRCLLTDPSVTNLTLQSESITEGRGRGLPQGMHVTFDPKRGALIRNLQTSFNGRYVCSGWKDGRQVTSRAVDLLVSPGHPPSLSVSLGEAVRLEGETFEVTCLSSNPSHFYSVAWSHPSGKTLNVVTSRYYGNSRLYINSTLLVSPVGGGDGGTYTCTGVNEAGETTAAASLQVLDAPYLRIYLLPLGHAKANGSAAAGELVANISMSAEANVSIDSFSSASVSGSRTVEVYDGEDVTLTFVTEAYPPIRSQRWTSTNIKNNNSLESLHSYTANSYRSESSLILRRVRHDDGGRYSFHFSNSFFRGSQQIYVKIYRSPSASIVLENGTFTCSSSGYPRPTVLWFVCPGLRDTCAHVATYQVSPDAVMSQEEEVQEHLRLAASPGDDVTVECVSSNQEGVSRRVHFVRKPLTVFSPPLIGALSSAAALFLLLLVVCYKWRQRPRYEIRWKIIESSDGNSYTFVDPTQLPYNQKWEFPRDKLRLGAVLGSGAFGKVVEATAYGLGTGTDVTRVAVKMLKPSAHSEEREALMSELKILSHLGYHDNIVNLLGACTQGGPMLMITEYCSHGDLLNFLRGHAQDFMASILSMDEVEGEVLYKNMAAQHARLRSDSGISCCSDYQEMQTAQSPGRALQGAETGRVSVEDLMRFSLQVAQGLDFLSSRNCIHRDVAARNVLLTHRCVAKICDFGLARDIRNDDSYIVQGNARLPVKWMAPESIFQCVYTVQSDVWSYGVLLWEIFSLGKSPYPNVAVDTNFYRMIKDGCHMTRPDFAPAQMYELMTCCWSLEPTDRPTFKMIGQLINRLLPSNQCSSQHDSEQAYSNIHEYREEDEEEEEGGVVRGGANKTEQPVSDEEDKELLMKNIYQLS
ncbi:uncharacterized protein V6R79_009021 [Siganus canaliculatus]